MAETDLHFDRLTDVAKMLKRRYEGRDNVYVSANLRIYDDHGNRHSHLAPDVFVVFGVPGHLRKVFKLWEERPPAFVLEITSEDSKDRDQNKKRRRYAAWGVSEYFLYDPWAEYLTPPLRGLSLAGGRYREMRERVLPNGERGLISEALGLCLWLRGRELRLYDPVAGADLPTPAEQDDRADAEAKARAEAEARVDSEATALLPASCATLRVDPLPDPIRPPRTLPAEETQRTTTTAQQEEGTTITTTPGVVIQRTVAEGIADRLGEDLAGPPIAVSFHDVPLVTFINEVFAERPGMSFTLSAGLAEKADLVTLRLTEPVPPNQLFATARRVLGDHGVNLREAGGVLTFAADQEIGAGDIPLPVSGRALPEVPPTHRTAFQLVPMRVARASDVANFLNQAFSGQELDIRPDIPTNTLLLRATVEMLGRAAEMIEVLDQPLPRGRNGVIIDPSFLALADLATDLEAVLAAEGYSVGTGGQISTAVVLLPLRGVNKLVAFASDAATLNHIREWARTVDARKEATVENAVFTYEVRNTQAASMQETLDAILMDGGTSAFQGVQGAATETATTAEDAYLGTGRIVVDENRNMLLFRGSGKEWAELRAVIEQLDKPVPSVLIELLIAEITLSDEEESGIEFLFRNGIGGGDTVTSSTLGALGVQAKALSMTLGQRRHHPRRPQPLLRGRPPHLGAQLLPEHLADERKEFGKLPSLR